MRKTLSLAALLVLSAGSLAGLPDDCEITYSAGGNTFTQYRWVGTTNGSCDYIAVEIPDILWQWGTTLPDFMFDDVVFDCLDCVPGMPNLPSTWNVDIF